MHVLELLVHGIKTLFRLHRESVEDDARERGVSLGKLVRVQKHFREGHARIALPALVIADVRRFPTPKKRRDVLNDFCLGFERLGAEPTFQDLSTGVRAARREIEALDRLLRDGVASERPDEYASAEQAAIESLEVLRRQALERIASSQDASNKDVENP